jgi:hypothetical protein
MKQRLPLVLSITALAVALLGSTPLGHAVTSAVPFARKAGYAYRAGNATAVHGIKAAKRPRPGFLIPLGADGRFPASVGQSGPAGARGPRGATGARGEPGSPGVSGYQIVHKNGAFDSVDEKSVLVSCPPDKKAIGGGGASIVGPTALQASYPVTVAGASSWFAQARETAPFAGDWYVEAYVLCAAVAA